MINNRFLLLRIAGVCFAAWAAAIAPVSAQDEAASAIRRYKAYEASTGYYEQYEVLPQHQRPLIDIPGIREDMISYSSNSAKVRNRSRLKDSHMGIRFYEGRRCVTCHTGAEKNTHTVRSNITCRQCHGGEPIASIEHYWSPLNPIRRHAYVCSKCHQGSSASYAQYVIHEPNPTLKTTQRTFPVLFYAFWLMVAIAAFTFILFIPHAVIWGIRELFEKKRR